MLCDRAQSTRDQLACMHMIHFVLSLMKTARACSVSASYLQLDGPRSVLLGDAGHPMTSALAQVNVCLCVCACKLSLWKHRMEFG